MNGPDTNAWEDARKLLVEGRPVAVGTTTVRFYPSYREVARQLESNVSKVARWAKREGILEQRRKVLATDRSSVRSAVPNTAETLVVETLQLINAAWATGARRASHRTTERLLRLTTALIVPADSRLPLLEQLEHLRASLMKGRAS